jgi:hypothetical protein
LWCFPCSDYFFYYSVRHSPAARPRPGSLCPLALGPSGVITAR